MVGVQTVDLTVNINIFFCLQFSALRVMYLF